MLCFSLFLVETGIVSLKIINKFIFVIEKRCVFSEVRTKLVNNIASETMKQVGLGCNNDRRILTGKFKRLC
jgi:hypothetical protein